MNTRLAAAALLWVWMGTGCASGSPGAKPPYKSFEDVDYGYGGARTIYGKRAKLALHLTKLEGPAPETQAPLVLLHPWGFSMLVWRDVAKALVQERTVLLVDLPGHGKSGKTAAALSMKRMAAAVLDAMDAAGLQAAHLAGNSMGGATALAVALIAPERVKSLILVSAPGSGAFPEVLQRMARSFATPRALCSLSGEAWSMGLAVAVPGTSSTAIQAREDMVRLRGAAEWPAFCRATSRLLQTLSSYSPPLESLQKPALVVHGEGDLLITESMSRRLAERIPDARLVVLEGCGHMSEVECPEALVRAMRAFLSAHN